MLKLNRTTEYGIMALTYIRGKNNADTLSSAREIADFYHLPFEILAKTLQKLKEHGVINSIYGTRGGYTLAKELNEINLAEFIGFMEGPNGVVSCLDIDPTSERTSEKVSCACEYHSSCGIKNSMNMLNKKMYEFLSRINMEELTHPSNLTLSSQSSSTTTLKTNQTPAQVSDNSSSVKLVAMSGEEP